METRHQKITITDWLYLINYNNISVSCMFETSHRMQLLDYYSSYSKPAVLQLFSLWKKHHCTGKHYLLPLFHAMCSYKWGTFGDDNTFVTDGHYRTRRYSFHKRGPRLILRIRISLTTVYLCFQRPTGIDKTYLRMWSSIKRIVAIYDSGNRLFDVFSNWNEHKWYNSYCREVWKSGLKGLFGTCHFRCISTFTGENTHLQNYIKKSLLWWRKYRFITIINEL